MVAAYEGWQAAKKQVRFGESCPCLQCLAWSVVGLKMVCIGTGTECTTVLCTTPLPERADLGDDQRHEEPIWQHAGRHTLAGKACKRV